MFWLAFAPLFLGIGQPPADVKIEVMVVGLYHMANPGLDVHNLKADDVLSPKRQKEIEALCMRLLEFRPTKIAVESPFPHKDAVEGNRVRKKKDYPQKYKEYLQGDLDVSRNEVYQVAFRLAKMAHLDRVQGIDEAGYYPYGKMKKFALENGLKELFTDGEKHGAEMMAEMQNRLSTNTVIEMLNYVNQPETLLKMHQSYLTMEAKLVADDNYLGPEILSEWYKRNLKIFANILRISQPNDRVVVFFGAGHAHILKQLIQDSPDMILVQPNEYLRGG